MRIAVIFSILLVLAACASRDGFPERSERVAERLEKLSENYFLPRTNVLEEYEALDGEKNRKAYRDEVIYGRILAVDLQFAVFKEALYKEGVTGNLALDMLGVGVGAAGAVVTSADASRILSALSGGISGTQTSINKNLYYDRTMPALMALMEAERQKILSEILKGLKSTAADYPLGRALIDLERYFQAGSIPGAIVSISKIAGDVNHQAQTVISAIRDQDFASAEAQGRVKNLLDIAEGLPAGAAWQILENPPSELDSFVQSAVQARLGGTALDNSADILSNNDAGAKAVLKMILVLLQDRSPDNLEKWRAAMAALSEQEG